MSAAHTTARCDVRRPRTPGPVSSRQAQSSSTASRPGTGGALTFRAVAARSGVNIRTVFRHFNTEVELRRAVMHRLEEEAGVVYEGLELGDLPTITERVFAVLPSFAVPPSEGPGRFPEEDSRRRQALVAAVKAVAADWSTPQINMAAGILDVIWSPLTYERLTTAWDLPPHEATEAVTWVIKLVTMAIGDYRGPGATPPAP